MQREPCGVPCTRRILALCIAALVVRLAPVAYADPPDPSWIGGFWDDADFDTVVVFIASTCALLVPAVVDAEPLWVSIARVKPADPDVVPAPFRSTSRPWAPPLSSLPLC